MQEELRLLRKLIESVRPLNDEDWDAFSGIWKPYTAGRKEVVTTAGQTENYLYFVVKGIQRVYYLDDQHREATLAFMYPPSFGGVVDSLLLGQPSRYYYETLTPSEFLRAPVNDLQAMMAKHPAIADMVRLGVTQTLSGILERLVEVQCFSSEDKFRNLLRRSPHILQLVPHKYLANYLGIDATNFSKLINKVRI
ncbi:MULTISPECIES: Crp/Fnr family transcriptional regulator [Dyadobacter]|uniref:Crp/Fnr family transcriptional regulator n=1 Tax=Dyadobacter chenhuakuii TaxID=2909339 RepID=A0ABY4XQ12_9BACT|nr:MULTISPECIES: Crp/Fnr family transcriptional regulator [Dyadobacter]MCF2493351.1 Crp/Fnr family transcriptional regulator [Dyadobacter chenhuakuii]MCF2517264.1 Crp/Fnr family transcriptional regulator [Dyadobacter sp. CY351]USJ32371.1 Crp/Fnr family transcriptional regulator [Dyadobacter chenhuakuii]